MYKKCKTYASRKKPASLKHFIKNPASLKHITIEEVVLFISDLQPKS